MHLPVSTQQGMILKSWPPKLCSARAAISTSTNAPGDSAETIATNDPRRIDFVTWSHLVVWISHPLNPKSVVWIKASRIGFSGYSSWCDSAAPICSLGSDLGEMLTSDEGRNRNLGFAKFGSRWLPSFRNQKIISPLPGDSRWARESSHFFVAAEKPLSRFPIGARG